MCLKEQGGGVDGSMLSVRPVTRNFIFSLQCRNFFKPVTVPNKNPVNVKESPYHYLKVLNFMALICIYLEELLYTGLKRY